MHTAVQIGEVVIASAVFCLFIRVVFRSYSRALPDETDPDVTRNPRWQLRR
jgi:hypothetical protein